MGKKGILLVNLGTPDSPKTADVRKYLDEFLMDGRVIDVNPVLRTLLVKGIIVPFRGPKSAKIYKEIWTEQGSPLLIYGKNVKNAIADRLGEDYHVELAMRYQSPSIPDALERLKQAKVDSIKVIPLFPQYASASTGSVHQLVMEIVSQWQAIPSISFVNSYYDHPGMIKVFADNTRKYLDEGWDHILFSFHGVPQRHMRKADVSGEHCLKVKDCCKTLTENNKFCYSAQCHQTAKLIAEELNLSDDKYSLCFQSRLGNDPWMQPYTSDVLKELAGKGVKRILVLCPAFVADCLETLFEISFEYQEEFEELGGEKVQLVESLNDNPAWIDALEDIILNKN
ncbi:ferrochelatase [Pedobacter aquae]|uniref:Ferrochelatase n=1 Tax=Pedobacter aquae TaxID=2605747 RepID=A0A5C0VIV8_9SPHI|nr:ferrochelatase [Pedobacter aquae]QEK52027.1 ferrochelatase [Pedobacter aquae]